MRVSRRQAIMGGAVGIAGVLAARRAPAQGLPAIPTDGTTDAWDAVTQQIAAVDVGELYLPEAAYPRGIFLSRELVMNRRVDLIGAGSPGQAHGLAGDPDFLRNQIHDGATRITSASPTAIIRYVNPDVTRWCRLEKVILQGRPMLTQQMGLVVENMGLMVRDVEISYTGSLGAYIRQSVHAHYDNIRISFAGLLNPDADGIQIWGDPSGSCNFNRWTGIGVYRSARHGILIGGGSRAQIFDGADIENNGGYGVYVFPTADGCRFLNHWDENNGHAAGGIAMPDFVHRSSP